MRSRITLYLMAMALASFWAPAGAQDVEYERVVLRVISVNASGATVDRGSRDGVNVGDSVEFFPREGGVYRGTVTEVSDRRAVVRIDDPKFKPAAGSRGEALVPPSRFQIVDEDPEPEPEPEPDPKKTDPEGGKTPEGTKDPEKTDGAPDGKTPEHPPWKNKDEDYKEGKPLLAEVRPVRPEQRRPKMTGRAYAIGALVNGVDGNFDSSLIRLGTDILLENLFKKGGRIRFNGEMNHRTENNQEKGLDLLIRRFSYVRGGTRYEPTRWEAGRFLHDLMPEFGVLDGFEWGQRRSNGHRWSVSIGFLPTPTDDFDTFEDFQVSFVYHWISDLNENFTATFGFQKTWHHLDPDRDLLIGKMSYVQGPGKWDFHASAWIDFYTGSDDIKGSGLELTHAIFQAVRRFASGSGIDVTFYHQRYPEIDRDEFLPILAAEIDDNRLDRLAVEGWWQFNERMQAHAHGRVWNDEEGTGGAAEFGFRIQNFPFEGFIGDVTGFATFAKFEDTFGGRISFGRRTPLGRWDALYEIANHHLLDFPPDVDDLIQHRARVSVTVIKTTWDMTAYVEVVLFDQENSWALGFSLQRRF